MNRDQVCGPADDAIDRPHPAADDAQGGRETAGRNMLTSELTFSGAPFGRARHLGGLPSVDGVQPGEAGPLVFLALPRYGSGKRGHARR